MSLSADAFRPAFAGGWLLTRVLFGLAALHAHLRRALELRDALSTPEITLGSGPLLISDHVLLQAPEAAGIWGVGLLGLLVLIAGGPRCKWGLAAFLACSLALMAGAGLNVRVAERLLIWSSLLLLMAPIDAPGLLTTPRSTFPRALLLVILGSLYLSTGLMKALEEPAWWDGRALQYDLLDRHHAGGPLAAWLSGQTAIVRPLSWFTLAFELGFVPMMLTRTLRRPALVAGLLLHLGIGLLMKVGSLGEVVLSLYPALMHPDDAEALTQAVRRTAPAQWLAARAQSVRR